MSPLSARRPLASWTVEELTAPEFNPYDHVYPDTHPLLRQRMPYTPPTEDALELADKLGLYMRRFKNAFGLAAPQVGWQARVIAIDPARIGGALDVPLPPPLVMMNPLVARQSHGQLKGFESCLSIRDPNDFANYTTLKGIVLRPQWVEVMFYDPARRKHVTDLFTGMEARVVMHELEHLNGVLFTDHLIQGSRLITHAEYDALLASGLLEQTLSGTPSRTMVLPDPFQPRALPAVLANAMERLDDSPRER